MPFLVSQNQLTFWNVTFFRRNSVNIWFYYLEFCFLSSELSLKSSVERLATTMSSFRFATDGWSNDVSSCVSDILHFLLPFVFDHATWKLAPSYGNLSLLILLLTFFSALQWSVRLCSVPCYLAENFWNVILHFATKHDRLWPPRSSVGVPMHCKAMFHAWVFLLGGFDALWFASNIHITTSIQDNAILNFTFLTSRKS